MLGNKYPHCIGILYVIVIRKAENKTTHKQLILLNRPFRRKSKKASKLRVTGLCAGNSPVIGEFPAQMASNDENAFIWWRHHEKQGSWHGFCSWLLWPGWYLAIRILPHLPNPPPNQSLDSWHVVAQDLPVKFYCPKFIHISNRLFYQHLIAGYSCDLCHKNYWIAYLIHVR